MRIGVIGCCGRMGRTVIREIVQAPDLELAGGIDRPDHPELGRDLGELAGLPPLGLRAGADLETLLDGAGAVVEFSTAEASIAHARRCAARGVPLVLGTTGFTAEQDAELSELARVFPLLVAPNMSLGVNLLLALTERVARALGPEFDIEIFEMHHRHKVDAPSGTALALGRAAAAGRGVRLEEVAVRAREGITGPRVSGTIGFASLRGGDVVGDHAVIFAGEGERIVLQHLASDRKIYARGALAAARWLVGRPPGRYGMRDVLGL
ncbi:MAG: 4-hydroxy-tetrahydrodipicolinate reductase [Geminicoccaceae bacterium]|nr:4-hydroxy-tetrahydrodipicolinate reductase [Geminicoccaceae bacterium]MCS7266604.1 4-hydroxy-tetrahydrodipicolinate reductase [Geminicoccaceae bacterium]MCX7630943.1 4-hydroxy-tetrahydrodipicolinate reductase [Geminicoccaceae bacterium]MDW8123237.1 4-hydroxy-tetrahydrodipicolinate reductase [Geminicoccaceae bacterium]MDW8340103.1 4-hydroxy-tetrahydrodipicolinate reductase [Geminicoccaceae bacterium]